MHSLAYLIDNAKCNLFMNIVNINKNTIFKNYFFIIEYVLCFRHKSLSIDEDSLREQKCNYKNIVNGV